MARIWHLFPGSNTAFGFVGFFEELHQQARRTVILKGGPGVGKSTLMGRVGKHFEKLGMDTGYYHCSGDPDSLDAVYAPQAGFLILDGTAPHVVDPAVPGARDGILNLGVCLNERRMEKHAEESAALKRDISACYAQATRYLRSALAVRQDAAAVYDAALDKNDCRMLQNELLALLPGGGEDEGLNAFAQAITWKGVLQETDAVLMETNYCLDLPWGFDADVFLRLLWEEAVWRGVKRTAYHDPLDPGKLLHVTVGKAAFTTAVMMDAPVFAPTLDASVLRRESARLAFDRAACELMQNQAVEALGRAKAGHDALERCYMDAMDYARLEEIQFEFLKTLP
jgi:hypothetical protein